MMRKRRRPPVDYSNMCRQNPPKRNPFWKTKQFVVKIELSDSEDQLNGKIKTEVDDADWIKKEIDTKDDVKVEVLEE